jgi:hypothetical protein
VAFGAFELTLSKKPGLALLLHLLVAAGEDAGMRLGVAGAVLCGLVAGALLDDLHFETAMLADIDFVLFEIVTLGHGTDLLAVRHESIDCPADHRAYFLLGELSRQSVTRLDNQKMIWLLSKNKAIIHGHLSNGNG